MDSRMLDPEYVKKLNLERSQQDELRRRESQEWDSWRKHPFTQRVLQQLIAERQNAISAGVALAEEGKPSAHKLIKVAAFNEAISIVEETNGIKANQV